MEQGLTPFVKNFHLASFPRLQILYFYVSDLKWLIIELDKEDKKMLKHFVDC